MLISDQELEVVEELVNRFRTRMLTQGVLSTGEVGELLGVSPATVKRWCDAGDLGCGRSPGRHRRITLASLVACCEKRKLKINKVSAVVLSKNAEGGYIARTITQEARPEIRLDLPRVDCRLPDVKAGYASVEEFV